MNYSKFNKKTLKIRLQNDEQITLKFFKGCEFDYTNKSWGAYITPSLFQRCKRFKLIPALVENKLKEEVKLVLVKLGLENLFLSSIKKENLNFVGWLKINNFRYIKKKNYS